MTYLDFNDADQQQSFDLIPKGTLARVRMSIKPGDSTPQAQAARRIAGFGNLDGLEFVARFDIEKDAKGEDKNTIKSVIEPDHKDYAVIIGVA